MASTEYLEQYLNELTNLFQKIEENLSAQYSAVVENDLEQLNDLADQQIELHGSIQEKEQLLKEEMQRSFNEQQIDDTPLKLSKLIENIDTENSDLESAREALIQQIANTQNQQFKLNDLLLFASDHVTNTLKSIYDLGRSYDKRYTPRGTTSSNDPSLINRTG